MDKKELKEQIREMPVPRIDPRRKEETLRLVMQAAGEYRGMRNQSFWQKAAIQAEYVSWKMWAAQGALLLALGGGCLFWNERMQGLIYLLVPMVGVLSALEAVRSYQYPVWEMEKTCRYDLRQIIFMRMLVIGGIDLLAVLFAAGMLVQKGNSLSLALLQLLVPFLLSNSLYYVILSIAGPRVSSYVLMGAAVLAAAGNCMVQARLSQWLKEGLGAGMETAAVLLAVLLFAAAVKTFLNGCDQEEKRQWNLD